MSFTGLTGRWACDGLRKDAAGSENTQRTAAEKTDRKEIYGSADREAANEEGTLKIGLRQTNGQMFPKLFLNRQKLPKRRRSIIVSLGRQNMKDRCTA